MSPHTELVMNITRDIEYLNGMIQDSIDMAKRLGIKPETMRDKDGHQLLAPLIGSRVQAYHALALLRSEN